MVATRANAIPSDRRSGGGRSRGGRSDLLTQRLDAPTSFLDRRCGAFGCDRHFKSRLSLPFAHAKNFHAVAPAGDDPGLHEALDRDRLGYIELTGVDRLLNAVEIDHIVIKPRGRAEPTLGLPAMQRHLAAFEALDADARPSRLALAATTGLLALARTDAAPDADAGLGRAGVVSYFVEFHGRRSLPAVDDAQQMRDFGDHAAIGGGVGDARPPPDPVEAQALERLALRARATNSAGRLLQHNVFVGAHRPALTNRRRRLRRPGGATAASTP